MHMRCSSYTTQDELDNAFCKLIAVVSEDLSRIWNSVELLQLYHSKVGQMLTKRQEVDQLVDHVGDNILVLSSALYSYIFQMLPTEGDSREFRTMH